jgi:hypothetical protein
MTQINLLETIQNAQKNQELLRSQSPIQTNQGTVTGLGEVSTAKRIAVDMGIPATSSTPTKHPWQGITMSSGTSGSISTNELPSGTTVSRTGFIPDLGSSDFNPMSFQSDNMMTRQGLLNEITGLGMTVNNSNSYLDEITKTIETLEGMMADEYQETPQKDVSLNQIMGELSEYGNVDSFDIGYTPEGTAYVKNIRLSELQNEQDILAQRYANYRYSAGYGSNWQGHTKASIWDYMSGSRQFDLRPDPYWNPYRDTIYNYDMFDVATPGYYSGYITTRWKYGIYDNSGKRSSISRWY